MQHDYSAFSKGDSSERVIDEITSVAESLRQRIEDVAALEKQLRDAKADVHHLGETVLPELMDQLGLASFKLKNGTQIDVAEILKAHLSKERTPAGLAWLREHGHDSIIKTQVVTEFVVGQDEMANELFQELQKRNSLDVKLESSVHHMTLTSAIKQLLEAGEDVPLATFGVERKRIAKLK